jgi:hypothetical protein
MACKCGGNRFVGRQVCRHDIVVDDYNVWQENCGTAEDSIYDAEQPYGPYTCLSCEMVWDELPQFKVRRMKRVEMALLRNDRTWDTLTMMVPEEEFIAISHEANGDFYKEAVRTRDKLTELALRLLKEGTDIARIDIYHIEDEWQESVIGGEPCLL